MTVRHGQEGQATFYGESFRGTTTASGSFVLKRLAFRIGDGDWKDTSMVADDVQVRFKLALTGVGAL